MKEFYFFPYQNPMPLILGLTASLVTLEIHSEDTDENINKQGRQSIV